MKKELFEELKQSLREAKLIKRGQRWMRRRTHDSRQPEGVILTDFAVSEAKWQGGGREARHVIAPHPLTHH
jgi:hypothetical protein